MDESNDLRECMYDKSLLTVIIKARRFLNFDIKAALHVYIALGVLAMATTDSAICLLFALR